MNGIERARRLATCYAILLDTFERSFPEPPQCSYAPNWGYWMIAYAILGLTAAVFSLWLL
jgi:hypothetical protein